MPTLEPHDPGGSAELTRVVAARGALRDTTTNGYNLAGSLLSAWVLREIGTQSPPYHPYPLFARQRTINRYGSNLQLMASETAFDTIDAAGFLYCPPPTTSRRNIATTRWAGGSGAGSSGRRNAVC